MKRYFLALVLLVCFCSDANAGKALVSGVSFTNLKSAWDWRDRVAATQANANEYFGAGAPIVVQEPAGSGIYYHQWAYYANGTSQETLDRALAVLGEYYLAPAYFDHILSAAGCADPRTDEERAAIQQELQQQQQQQEQQQGGENQQGEQGGNNGGGGQQQTTVRIENGENTVNVYVSTPAYDPGNPPESVQPSEGHDVGYSYNLQPLEDPTFNGRYVTRTVGTNAHHSLKYQYNFNYQQFKADFYNKFTQHFPIDDLLQPLQSSSSGGMTLAHIVLDWDFPEMHVDIDPSEAANSVPVRLLRTLLVFLVCFETIFLIIKLFK